MLAQNLRYLGKEADKFFMRQAFKTAGRLFEVFDQEQKSVIVPWGDGEAIVEKLLASGGCVSKSICDTAKPYTVSVFSYQLERLSECAAITAIGDGQILLLDKKYYDNNTGIIVPKKGEEICDTLIL